MESLGWLLVVLPFFFCTGTATFLPNQLCHPQQTLIHIDHPQYAHYPYIVQLHRCGGACGTTSPNVKNCAVLKTKNVTLTVLDTINERPKLITLVNHTQCGCQCVVQPSDCNAVQEYHKDTCSCKCRYKDTPPSPCPKGQRWSTSTCECECDKAPDVCPVGKSWSSRACGCVCDGEMVSQCERYGMVVDDNCKCVKSPIEVGAHTGDKPNDNPKFTKFTLLFMVGEFVLMCIIFDAILYQKKFGIIYSIVKRCKGQSKEIKTQETNMGKDNTDMSSVSAREEYDEKV